MHEFIKFGVPQSARSALYSTNSSDPRTEVLGPLLFVLYSADLADL